MLQHGANLPTETSLRNPTPSSMIGHPDVPSVQLASTASSTTITAPILQIATITTANAHARPDLEAMTARFPYAARWLTT